MSEAAQSTEAHAALGTIGGRCGIAGAVMLSMNNVLSPYGYVLFLISSLCLLYWGRANNFRHQIEMQLVFTAVNTFGLYNWILKPLLA